MTLGLAGAIWTNEDQRMVFVTSDSRFSFAKSGHVDVGLKTYDLGGQCAIVASGDALPPLMAADQTRSVVELHNRKATQPITFFTTVKLFSFFMRRAARDLGGSSRVGVVGFLEGGEPCIAHVRVSPTINRTNFLKLGRGDVKGLPVGSQPAARLLVEAMARARREKRPVVAAAVSMLYCIAKNEGAFTSVGGGLSFGMCAANDTHFRWPPIEIDHLRFLRGADVTKSWRPGWPVPDVIDYDEGWYSSLDQELALNPPPGDLPPQGIAPGYDIDEAIPPESLFTMTFEPKLDLLPVDPQAPAMLTLTPGDA